MTNDNMVLFSLQWRHNQRDGVSNHQPHDCLLNRLFRRRSKKTSKLCVTGLCAGNSPVTSEFPTQKASNAANISIWWRHHVFKNCWSNGVDKGVILTPCFFTVSCVAVLNRSRVVGMHIYTGYKRGYCVSADVLAPLKMANEKFCGTWNINWHWAAIKRSTEAVEINSIKISLSNLEKLYSVLTWKISIRSCKNLTHATTAGLSWKVCNCDLTWL